MCCKQNLCLCFNKELLLCDVISYIKVYCWEVFFRDEDGNSAGGDLVRQKDSEKTMDGAREQQRRFKKNVNKCGKCIQNQKEAVEIFAPYDGVRRHRKIGIHWTQERHWTERYIESPSKGDCLNDWKYMDLEGQQVYKHYVELQST